MAINPYSYSPDRRAHTQIVDDRDGPGGNKVKRNVVRLKEAPLEFPYLTERYLRRLVYERRLRTYRCGRNVYLAREDLEKLLIETPAASGGGW